MNAADEAVRLFSVARLAELWGVSKEYIYEEIRSKRLPAVQLGNGDRDKLRIASTDAARWVDEHRLGRAS